MAHARRLMGSSPLKVSEDELQRFSESARIKDPAGFAATLDALIGEKLALAQRAAQRNAGHLQSLQAQAGALRASSRWAPAGSDIQRGRQAQLQVFEQPENLPIAQYARLAGKSRQQLYKDIGARPPRLLSLSVGPRGLRIPDWQLDPLRHRLVREVLERCADDIDLWTVHHALTTPQSALGGRSPVQAVTPAALEHTVRRVLDVLGVH